MQGPKNAGAQGCLDSAARTEGCWYKGCWGSEMLKLRNAGVRGCLDSEIL